MPSEVIGRNISVPASGDAGVPDGLTGVVTTGGGDGDGDLVRLGSPSWLSGRIGGRGVSTISTALLSAVCSCGLLVLSSRVIKSIC